LTRAQCRQDALNAAQAAAASAQVEVGHEFRRHIEASWEAWEQSADDQLQKAVAASDAELASREASKKLRKRGFSRDRKAHEAGSESLSLSRD